MNNNIYENRQNIPVTNQFPINCDEPMSVTSLADLQSYAAGTVVRFPDFAEGQPFVAKVRRPSLLMLAKQGKIPNTLLNAASDLFAKGGGGLNPKDENMLGDMYDIMQIICSSSLIQPSVQEQSQYLLAYIKALRSYYNAFQVLHNRFQIS